MPLGAIHLILSEGDRDKGAEFFCGVKDAIAAVHPVRIPHFPASELCSKCLAAYRENGNEFPPAAGHIPSR
jgi:hypothetical protein